MILHTKFGIKSNNTLRAIKSYRSIVYPYSYNKNKNWQITNWLEQNKFPIEDIIHNVILRYKSHHLGRTRNTSSWNFCSQEGKSRSRFLIGYNTHTQKAVTIGKYLAVDRNAHPPLDQPIFIDVDDPVAYQRMDVSRTSWKRTQYRKKLDKLKGRRNKFKDQIRLRINEFL